MTRKPALRRSCQFANSVSWKNSEDASFGPVLDRLSEQFRSWREFGKFVISAIQFISRFRVYEAFASLVVTFATV
jgi:hypothetical protein